MENIKNKSYKQLQKEKMKDKLYRTAIKLFNEKGYHNTTILEICNMCGIAKGTYYLYFQSKEDIIKMSFANGIDAYLEEHIRDEIEADLGDSVTSRILFYISTALHYCKVVGREVTTLAFIFNLKQQLGSQKINNLEEKRTIYLRKLIHEGMMEGLWLTEYSEEDVLGVIDTFITGAMMTWCFSFEDYDIDIQNKKMAESLLKGIIITK